MSTDGLTTETVWHGTLLNFRQTMSLFPCGQIFLKHSYKHRMFPFYLGHLQSKGSNYNETCFFRAETPQTHAFFLCFFHFLLGIRPHSPCYLKQAKDLLYWLIVKFLSECLYRYKVCYIVRFTTKGTCFGGKLHCFPGHLRQVRFL